MRPRWRKVLADFWDNKSRSLMVILSIAVGIFAVGMIAGAYIIISNDMSASYASSNPANIEIWTDPFDDDFVGVIQNLPGVQTAEGRRFVNVKAKTENEQWVGLDLVAIPDYEASQINTLMPLEGATVPQEKQALIERDTLEKVPAVVGKELEIQLPDNTIKKLPVAGIVLDQSTGAGDFLALPLGYVTHDTLEWLHQPANYNRLYVTVAEQPNNEEHIREIARRVTDQLEQSGRQSYRTQFSKRDEHPMESTVQAVLGVLGALGVLILLLSSSLIANTLSALLSQHTRYIGVIKLVGGRSYQITSMYMTLIVFFGLAALAIAIPLGGQAAYALSQLIAKELNFNLLGYRIVPAAVVLEIVIGLAVPLAAGYFPVRKGARISVQDAFNGNASQPSKPGGKGLAGLGERWRRRTSQQRLSRPLLISLRNTFRRKGRLALTLFTLTMGGAIFIAVFNVRDSLDRYIDDMGDYFLADVTVNFDRPYRLQEISQAAMQVEGVEYVEGWAYANAEILRPDDTVAENLQILAPPADSPLVSPKLLAGRWIEPGDQTAITVSEGILETYPHLKPGDKLRLKIADHEALWSVVGIFKFVGNQNTLAYANYDYLADLLGLRGRSFSYRILTDQHDKLYQKQASQQIEQVLRLQGYKVGDVEAGRASIETAAEALDVLVAFLLIMALLTALVGSIGLAGTMGMNVLERTREIGVMRAVGAVDLEVIKAVIVEGVLIGSISWVLGAALSFPITAMLASIIGLAIFSTPIAIVFTPLGFLIWLGLVVLLSALASVLPAHNAARLTIREVLAYE
jgi:putative ABC transport system permease protein